MVCPGCGERNRDTARFCTYCGTTLVQRCPACDNEIVPGGRFCDSCGTAVDASVPAPATVAAPTVAARKVVTVLFADLTGSTALEERMDAESVRSILDRFYAAMRAEIERHGGRLVKFTGDGAMAAFGVPEVHEDDAARAVDAALAMRSELEQLAEDLQLELALKIGINTGEVVVSETDDDVVGDAVNVASRLEGAATGGEILVGEDTWRLTRATSRYEPVEPLTLKGKAEPVPAYRLLAVDERTADSAAAPFVGRERELGRLLAAFQEAVDAKAARLVTIIGSPGLGKTRLSRELMAEVADVAAVRETRCDPAGESTFAPIADLMRATIGISELDSEQEVIDKLAERIPADDADRDRIAMRAAAILGVGLAGTTEETFWAIRRLIENRAREQPVVLVLDDIHWAEPLLLDLVEHLAEWITDAPVLIVGTARPELRDIRPSLVEGGRAAAVIALEGLDQRATAQLALNLLETDSLPDELLAKIPVSTEGNPLFVRELVRMLVDDHVLLRTGDGWTVTRDVDAIEVPPTISSLLAARIDRLRSDERTIVELASVVGKEFYRGVLHELAPPAMRDLVDGVLESLRRKEIVEPVGTYWIDEPVYRFHHVLIRDAAYRRLLKESRAELHERVATWLQEKTAGVLGEHDELIGYHLEQAHEYKRQLGRPDEQLGGRAASLLGAAAQRALDRDDLPAAAALSGRALERLSLGDAGRSELLLIRCESLLSMGDVAQGAVALASFESLASSPRMRAWATCFAGHLANLTAPERWETTERDVAAAAAELLTLGDEAGAAKAHTVHAQALAKRGRFAECEAVLDDALTAARAANDRRRITATLGFLPHAVLWGPLTVSRAGGRCLDIVRLLRITTGSPAVEATSLRCQAVLEAFRGRTDAARRMLRSARRTLTELGLQHELLDTEQFAGIVELVGGDPAAASLHLHEAFDGYKRTGVDVLAAQSAALLARAHLLLGEEDQSAELIEMSERSASGDLKATVYGLAAKAELLARRGEFASAREAAEQAVELASKTDALFDHGNALRSLAAVLRAAGDAAGAQGAEDRALALFERKGATALLERDSEPQPASEAGTPTPVRGVMPNASLRAVTTADDAVCRGDFEGLMAHFSEDVVREDHRSGLRATIVGTEALAREFAEIVRDNTVSSSLIATRGERLALAKSTWRVGRSMYIVEVLLVNEVDEAGLTCRFHTYDLDSLDAAFKLLDERFALGEGAVAARCIGLNARFLSAVNSSDGRGMREVLADDLVVTDHRPASLVTMSGDEWVASLLVKSELAHRHREVAVSFPRVARDLVLYDMRITGFTDEDVEFENALYVLVGSGAEKLTHVEMFPSDQLEQALARFDALASSPTAANPANIPVNRCVQELARSGGAMNRGDVEHAFARHADGFVREDRRSGLGTTVVGKDANIREMALVAVDGNQVSDELLATRGDRLALMATTWRVRRSGYVVEHLSVAECDDVGLMTGLVSFDRDEVDAAFAELDARFAAGEGAIAAECVTLLGRFFRGVNAADRDEMRAVVSADLALTDHRPVSLGSSTERDDWIASVVVLASELSSSFSAVPISYLRLGADIALSDIHVSGRSKDGAEFEDGMYILARAESGSLTHIELFGSDQLDAALARFAELAPSEHLENAATRSNDAIARAALAGDWETYEQLFASDCVLEDRRPGLRAVVHGVAGRRDLNSSIASVGARIAGRAVVATRGSRLALSRTEYLFDDSDYEAEILVLNEVDTDGLSTETIVFDPDDIDAAFAELDDRFVAGEGHDHATVIQANRRPSEAFNRRDWDEAREAYADSFVAVDHRPMSLGTLPTGRDSVVNVVRERASLIPDQVRRHVVYHAIAPDRYVVQSLNTGTSTEGVYTESVDITVGTVRDGVIASWDIYPLEALDAALARFDELGAAKASVATIDNAAMRAIDTSWGCLVRGDWDGLRAGYAPDAVEEDRRAGLGNVATLDDTVESAKLTLGFGADRYELVPLAVRGDRFALARVVLGSSRDDPYEAELLEVVELDDQGRFSWAANFDADDFDAAYETFVGRSIVEAAAVVRRFVDIEERVQRAMDERDWDAYAACLADGFVMVDHRPVSLGERDAHGVVEARKALVEVMPDLVSYHAARYATDVHGTVTLRATFGHTSDRELLDLTYVSVATFAGDKIARAEVYPVERLDDALARFDELRPSPGVAIDNAAMRALYAMRDTVAGGDLSALAELLASDVVEDDRRIGIANVYQKDEVIETAKLMADEGAGRYDVVPIAVRGERLALGRQIHSLGPYVIELIKVLELDDDGKIRSMVEFDADDIDAAYRELDERYIFGEGAEHADVIRVYGALPRPINERRWSDVRTLLADELVVRDHRPASLGDLSGQGWLDALRVLVETIPDFRATMPSYHAIAGDRYWVQMSNVATNSDGGAVDLSFQSVGLVRDGRIVRHELFPDGAEDEARALFESLGPHADGSPPELENAATRATARATSILMSKDHPPDGSLLAPDARLVDHRAGLRWESVGRDAMLERGREYASTYDDFNYRPLAIRGERLALGRTRLSRGDDVSERLQLTELDGDGRIVASEFFDPDDLNTAMTVLDERYIAGEGAPFADVLRLRMRTSAALSARDWETYRSLMAEDVVQVDRRPAGGGTLRGPDENVRYARTLTEVAPDLHVYAPEIVALAPDRLLVSLRTLGSMTGDDPFEIASLRLYVMRDGLVTRIEAFPVDAVDLATARFHELGPRPDVDVRLENTATRTADLNVRALLSGDLATARTHIAADAKFVDHRRGLRWESVGVDEILDRAREYVSTYSDGETRVIAVRGDRLALSHQELRTADDVSERLVLREVDAEGRLISTEWFEPDDPAAYVELERRYEAGEGRPYEPIVSLMRRTEEAHLAHDWLAFSALHDNDIVTIDHGPASAGALLGIEALVRYLQGHVEVAPDIRLTTTQIVRISPDAMLRRRRVGSRETETEMDFIELDVQRDGRYSHIECFPPERLAEATARFDELGPRPDVDVRLENTAVRTMRSHYRAIVSGDLDAWRATVSPNARLADHRPGLRWEAAGPDAILSDAHEYRSAYTEGETRPVAIRGDRLALAYRQMRTDDGDVSERLVLHEVGADGRLVAMDFFDPDDPAAHAELQRRYEAGEGRPYRAILALNRRVGDAHRARDWAAFAALHHDDIVMVDHRPASAGTIEGVDAVVRWVQGLVDVAPDMYATMTEIVRIGPDMHLRRLHVESRATGAEIDYLALSVMRDGRVSRLENFAPEQLADAIVRFDELGPRSDAPLLENAATRQIELSRRILDDADWDDAHRYIADDVELDDRRHVVRSVGRGRDAWIANFKAAHDLGFRSGEGQAIAIRGDRLSLNDGWMQDADGNQLAALQLNELDASGLFCRFVWFDPEDGDAAFAELDRRYLETDPPHADVWRVSVEMSQAHDARDWERFGSVVAPDVVLVDRRPVSLGRVEGRDACVAALSAIADVIPDVRVRAPEIVAISACALLSVLKLSGTNAEGGAVELPRHFSVLRIEDGVVRHIEMIPLDERDIALARFEELDGRAGPRENAATRAMKLVDRNLISGNPEASRSLYAEDVELYDVRAGVRLTLRGVDARIEDMRSAVDVGVRQVETTVVATRGDRLSLHRLVFAGAGPDPYEIEFLSIAELDADGLITSSYRFDGSNLDGAFELLEERFIAGEGAPYASYLRMLTSFVEAVNARDWDSFSTWITEDFVLIDHRPVSLGERLGPDEFKASFQALTEVYASLRIDIVSFEELGDDLAVGHVGGTGTDEYGGELDFGIYSVGQFHSGREYRLEHYPLDRLDDALARFRELEAGPPPRLANTAARSNLRWADAYRRQDWDAIRSLYADGFHREDRRRAIHLAGGSDQQLDSVREMANLGFTEFTGSVVATRGDRLAMVETLFTDERGNEIASFSNWEVDAQGRRVWAAMFDIDDLDAAFADLDARYLATEGAEFADVLRPVFALLDAHRTRDWDAWRAGYHDDLIVIDHRPAGWGVIRGADAWIEHSRALVDISPDVRIYDAAYHAIGRGVFLREMLTKGTNSEGGDVEIRYLWISVRQDGKVARIEAYPLERFDDAIARFRELEADVSPQAETQHWAPENTAARTAAQGLRNILAGEWELLASDADYRLEDRRSGLQWESSDSGEVLERIQEYASVYVSGTDTRLASWGDRLLLARRGFVDATGWTSERLIVFEVDEDGAVLFIAFFDPDDIEGAVVELTERFATGEGAPYADVVRLDTRLAITHAHRDWLAYADCIAADFVMEDHRPASGGTITGRDEFVRYTRAMVDVMPGAHFLVRPEIIAIAPDRMLRQRRLVQTNDDGSVTEFADVSIVAFREGLLSRIEQFPIDEADAALARFHELGPQDASGAELTNLCVEISLREIRAFMEPGDWSGFTSMFLADATLDDRRSGLRHLASGPAEITDYRRAAGGGGLTRLERTPIATRGDCLALFQVIAQRESDVEYRRLILQEVDPHGLITAQVLFDADDLDAAFDELDERYIACEGASFADDLSASAALLRAHRERDWDGYRACYADDLEVVDHRPAGWGVVRGAEAWMQLARSAVDVMPDAIMRVVAIHAIAAHGAVKHMVMAGTNAGGGHVELSNVYSVTVRRDGKLVRNETFPIDALDAALARFDELGSKSAPKID